MGRPPLLRELQGEKPNNPEIRMGLGGGGATTVISLEQDAEESNLLWSDSLKAKNKLTGGSLGSLAAWSQYFIINDNNKKKGRRKGILPTPLPKHTHTHTPASSGAHNSTGSRRKEPPGRMKNGVALVLVCLPVNVWIGGAPLWDSAWFIRTSTTGNQGPNGWAKGETS